MVHTSKPCRREAKAVGSGQGHQLFSKFKAYLGYKKPCLRKINPKLRFCFLSKNQFLLAFKKYWEGPLSLLFHGKPLVIFLKQSWWRCREDGQPDRNSRFFCCLSLPACPTLSHFVTTVERWAQPIIRVCCAVCPLSTSSCLLSAARTSPQLGRNLFCWLGCSHPGPSSKHQFWRKNGLGAYGLDLNRLNRSGLDAGCVGHI